MSDKQVKPGDLAVIVNEVCPENIGAIVLVGSEVPMIHDKRYRSVSGRWLRFGNVSEKRFEVTTQGRSLVTAPFGDRFTTRPILASRLLPIRENPGTDETLTWVPKTHNAPEHV